MNPLRILAAVAALAAAAQAQSMVEYSLGTARAAGSAAGMNSAGKAAAGVMQNAAKTLEKAGTAQQPARSSTTVVLPSPGQESSTPVKFTAPDPAQIKPGMESAELIRKFGEPAMKISGSADSQASETWWFGMDPDTVTVKLRDGKVVAVTPSPAPQGAKKNEPSTAPNPSNSAVNVLR